MERNLGTMASIDATLWTDVLDYRGHVHGRLGYSVVRFAQTAKLPDVTIRSICVATIVWSWRGGRWREAHRHQSLEHSERIGPGGNAAAIRAEG